MINNLCYLKFSQRLIDMQKYFHAEGDLSTCNPNGNLTTSNASASTANLKSTSDTTENKDNETETTESDGQEEKVESEEDEEEYAATNDPFYDRIPWFQPIGRWAFLISYLHTLALIEYIVRW